MTQDLLGKSLCSPHDHYLLCYEYLLIMTIIGTYINTLYTGVGTCLRISSSNAFHLKFWGVVLAGLLMNTDFEFCFPFQWIPGTMVSTKKVSSKHATYSSSSLH